MSLTYPWDNLSEQFINCKDKHIILDFETLANAQKHPNCVTPSIGILVFDPSEMVDFDTLVKRALRIKFNWREQIAMGRYVDNETVEWWKDPKQADAFKRVILEDGSEVSLSRFVHMIQVYLDRMGWSFEDTRNGGMVWSRGNAFDMPLYTNICDSFGAEEHYPFWAIRCIRTRIDAITEVWNSNHYPDGYVDCFPWPENAVKHIETHDIALDVLQMQYTQVKLYEFLNTLAAGGNNG